MKGLKHFVVWNLFFGSLFILLINTLCLNLLGGIYDFIPLLQLAKLLKLHKVFLLYIDLIWGSIELAVRAKLESSVLMTREATQLSLPSTNTCFQQLVIGVSPILAFSNWSLEFHQYLLLSIGHWSFPQLGQIYNIKASGKVFHHHIFCKLSSDSKI